MFKFKVWLLENIQCNGTTAYWVSGEYVKNQIKDDISLGFSVPRWKPKTHPKIEQIFESIRSQNYPNKISRINPPCIFLARTVNEAQMWLRNMYPTHPPDQKSHIYEVCLNGKYFVADGDCITNSGDFEEPETEETITQMAHFYWQGKNPKGGEKLFSPEMICDGTATVISTTNANSYRFKVGDIVIEKAALKYGIKFFPPLKVVSIGKKDGGYEHVYVEDPNKKVFAQHITQIIPYDEVK